MKVYISGKITGCPDYKERFSCAEKLLTAQGHTVMNPAILPDGFTHGEYMTICLSMLHVCDAIYLLENWRDSDGAIEEMAHAKRLHLKRIYEKGCEA